MSYRVISSKRFLKTVKKHKHSGKEQILQDLEAVVDLLALHDTRSLFVLYERWRDHPLKGDRQGVRELHVSMDDLLLYRVDEGTATIKLLDIVNHEELRKKR